jgi:Tol biopolymer transport system component
MRWFALLTLIAISAVGWSGSNAQETQVTGTIAFVRGSNLWVMRPDGSEQRKLTRGPRWKATPVWSPDGRKIAYASPARKQYGSRILIVNADGNHELTVTRRNYGFNRYPVWSPDGRRIAFEQFDGCASYAVSVVGANGSGERRLTPGDRYARPAWSPDGRIAFTHVHRGAVYVIRPDGSDRRVLAKIPGAKPVWGVAWSPDGRLIAFIGDGFLWAMNADGTHPLRLHDRAIANRGTRGAEVAWSPDSRQLAFAQGARDREIFVVNADGSGLRKLTDNRPVNDADPVWSPDGRAIAFTSDRDGNSEIYVMDADGSNQRNVSQNPLNDSDPTWSPAPR